jgi:hypothetical protein
VVPARIVGAAVGEPADVSHPRGTLFVAAPLASCGGAILEWDLAASKLLRTACLGLPAASMHLVRAGERLYALNDEEVHSGRTLVVVELPSLRVVRRVDLGAGGTSGIATDGTLIAVASEVGSERHRWSLTTLDATANVLARTELPGELQRGRHASIVVLGGAVYAGVTDNVTVKPRLIELDARGAVVKQLPLDVTDAHVSLAVRRGTLLVAGGQELLEVSPRLEILARHSVPVSDGLAVAADGRVLTGEGEILTDAFTRERSLPWAGQAVWMFQLLWMDKSAVRISADGTGAGPVVVTWVALP